MSVRQEQSRYAALRWCNQSSPTVNLPAVTSSHDDLLGLAHRLSYVGGLLVGASGYGGDYGGTEGVELRWHVGGGHSEASSSSDEHILPKTNSTRLLTPGEADGGPPATVTGLAVMLRRGFARRWSLSSTSSGH